MIPIVSSAEELVHEGEHPRRGHTGATNLCSMSYDHEGLALRGVDLHKVCDLQAHSNSWFIHTLKAFQAHLADLGGTHPPKVTRSMLLHNESLALVLQKIISSTLRLSQYLTIGLEKVGVESKRGLDLKGLVWMVGVESP